MVMVVVTIVGLIESDIDAAIESFNQVVYMETTKGEW